MNSIWGNIFEKGKAERKSIISILKGVPIFSDLKKSELKEFERIIHHRHFKADEIIFWEREPGVGMYIIQQGSVGIFKNSEEGNTEELARLENGDFFGEMALLDESPRSATAIALEDSHILGLFRPDLLGLLERKPRLGTKVLLKLAQMMAERLRLNNEELQTLRAKFDKSEIIR